MSQLEIPKLGIWHTQVLPFDAEYFPEGVDPIALYEEMRQRSDVTGADITAFEQEFLPEA